MQRVMGCMMCFPKTRWEDRKFKWVCGLGDKISSLARFTKILLVTTLHQSLHDIERAHNIELKLLSVSLSSESCAQPNHSHRLSLKAGEGDLQTARFNTFALTRQHNKLPDVVDCELTYLRCLFREASKC